MTDTPKKRTAARPDHETRVDTYPDSYAGQGGRVTGTCTCGWTQSERYERDRFAPALQERMQQAAGEHARKGGA